MFSDFVRSLAVFASMATLAVGCDRDAMVAVISNEGERSLAASKAVSIESECFAPSPSLIYTDEEEFGCRYASGWYAYKVDQWADREQSVGLLIVRKEGVTGQFAAALEIDCANMAHSWQWGIQWGYVPVEAKDVGSHLSDANADSVEDAVVGNAVGKYCGK